MTDLTAIAAAFGHEPEEPVWRTTSAPPVPPEDFGRDHWSTFAYVETRTVEYRGTIDHDHMRCHGNRHPIMLAAKTFRGGGDGSRYPTILAGGRDLPNHDDYDCLDDLIAAGLLEVHLPWSDGWRYTDAYDRPVAAADGALISPGFTTGLDELWLCVHATFSLTEKGQRVASALRAHKAGGGSFGTFRWSR